MSTALAIAGVTAVLRDLLNDGIINHNVSGIIGSTVSVSVLPPDRVVAEDGAENSRLNLFLHQVTPNTGLRNEGLPARDPSGRKRLANPPLALNLHYLVSAYGSADLHREILLGYVMQLLHERPVLDRQAIRTALQPSPDVGDSLPPALRALANSGLAEQMEQLRITQEFLNSEEMSKLWTAAQSSYRPTAAYQVSVVLIESTVPARVPLPVLSRGPVVAGREQGILAEPDLLPALPTLEQVQLVDGRAVVQLGKDLILQGHHLDGVDHQVRLIEAHFGIDEWLSASGGTPQRMQFQIPSTRAVDFPVGVYQVAVQLLRPDEDRPRESNRLALVLAAELTDLPKTVTRDGSGGASFSLQCRPEIRPNQVVTLILGQQEFVPNAFSASTHELTFEISKAPVGEHLARLRVDGIDSPIIDHSVTPPVFLDKRLTIQ